MCYELEGEASAPEADGFGVQGFGFRVCPKVLRTLNIGRLGPNTILYEAVELF